MEETLFEIGGSGTASPHGGDICVKSWGKNDPSWEIRKLRSCKEEINLRWNSWNQKNLGGITCEKVGEVGSDQIMGFKD